MENFIFIPHDISPDYFGDTFLINSDQNTYSKFVYTAVDTAEAFTTIKNFGAQHGISVPNYDLCDKQKNGAKFAAAGFSTFATVAVTTRTDLENFPYENIILKPTVSFGTDSRSHTLNSLMYCVRKKTELLVELDALGVFSSTLTVDEPFIAQQVADGDNDNYAALIMSGAVNGQGDVWHCPPLELETYFKDKVRNVRSVWAEENNTSEVLSLQHCVNLLLSTENTKNCFYQLQFLRSGNVWVPHDFQFRLTYYSGDYLGTTQYAGYRNAMLNFAFDEAIDKPVLPTVFGLNIKQNPVFRPTIRKKFITGASKTEVLGLLDPL